MHPDASRTSPPPQHLTRTVLRRRILCAALRARALLSTAPRARVLLPATARACVRISAAPYAHSPQPRAHVFYSLQRTRNAHCQRAPSSREPAIEHGHTRPVVRPPLSTRSVASVYRAKRGAERSRTRLSRAGNRVDTFFVRPPLIPPHLIAAADVFSWTCTHPDMSCASHLPRHLAWTVLRCRILCAAPHSRRALL